MPRVKMQKFQYITIFYKVNVELLMVNNVKKW
jgi:hypothetical protein